MRRKAEGEGQPLGSSDRRELAAERQEKRRRTLETVLMKSEAILTDACGRRGRGHEGKGGSARVMTGASCGLKRGPQAPRPHHVASEDGRCEGVCARARRRAEMQSESCEERSWREDPLARGEDGVGVGRAARQGDTKRRQEGDARRRAVRRARESAADRPPEYVRRRCRDAASSGGLVGERRTPSPRARRFAFEACAKRRPFLAPTSQRVLLSSRPVDAQTLEERKRRRI